MYKSCQVSFLLLSFAQESLLFDLSLSLIARLKPKTPFYVNCNTWLIQHEKPKGFARSSVDLLKQINFFCQCPFVPVNFTQTNQSCLFFLWKSCTYFSEVEGIHESRRDVNLYQTLFPNIIKHIDAALYQTLFPS